MQPPPAAQRRAVISAIRDIIWHAVPSVSGSGRRNHAVLALRGGRAQFGRSPACPPDGFTETLLLQRCASIDELEATIEANYDMVSPVCSVREARGNDKTNFDALGDCVDIDE